MPVGKFLSGDYEGVSDEINELKQVCGEHAMKVILETGDLGTAANIKKASILAMYAGADYIKTSTGKEKISATPEAAYVMCQAIKEYYDETGIQIGFKPAGGINTVMDAVIYYTIVKEVRERSSRREMAHQQVVPPRHKPSGKPAAERDCGRGDQVLLNLSDKQCGSDRRP